MSSQNQYVKWVVKKRYNWICIDYVPLLRAKVIIILHRKVKWILTDSVYLRDCYIYETGCVLSDSVVCNTINTVQESAKLVLHQTVTYWIDPVPSYLIIKHNVRFRITGCYIVSNISWMCSDGEKGQHLTETGVVWRDVSDRMWRFGIVVNQIISI